MLFVLMQSQFAQKTPVVRGAHASAAPPALSPANLVTHHEVCASSDATKENPL